MSHEGESIRDNGEALNHSADVLSGLGPEHEIAVELLRKTADELLRISQNLSEPRIIETPIEAPAGRQVFMTRTRWEAPPKY